MANSIVSEGPRRDWKTIDGPFRRRATVYGLFVLALLLCSCSAGRSLHSGNLTRMDTAALIQTARGQLGVRYCPGGTSPQTGFDCSGFTHWVFLQHGASIPRQSDDQYQIGQVVKRSRLQCGDLVFFETEKKGASHVGIYMEDDWFIHSSSSGGGVREENMNLKYWQEHYLGARRLVR
jgi:cell wall-associated NlpC family hydrolase